MYRWRSLLPRQTSPVQEEAHGPLSGSPLIVNPDLPASNLAEQQREMARRRQLGKGGDRNVPINTILPPDVHKHQHLNILRLKLSDETRAYVHGLDLARAHRPRPLERTAGSRELVHPARAISLISFRLHSKPISATRLDTSLSCRLRFSSSKSATI